MAELHPPGAAAIAHAFSHADCFLKYRLQLPGFELPESVRLRQKVYDEASARLLEQTADRIEVQPQIASNAGQPEELLKRTLHDAEAEALRQLPAAQAQSFVTLLRQIDALTTCLAAEIATKFAGSS
jgi:hypothetical protein